MTGIIFTNIQAVNYIKIFHVYFLLIRAKERFPEATLIFI